MTLEMFENYPAAPVRLTDDECKQHAVDLITELVQVVFQQLDEKQLVAEAEISFNQDERNRIAEYINKATVQLEVDFNE